MAIEWIRESARDAQYTRGEDDKTTGTRSWLAKATSPATSPLQVIAMVPVGVGDAFPGDTSLRCTKIRARPTGADGMLWTATADYEVRPAEEPEEPEDPEQPDLVPGKPPVWSASSSVSSGPIYEDRNGVTITNSAGDPLEDLTADIAEYRLTLTFYRLSHTQWAASAREYTNAINNGNWNGGAAGEWKCQGISAKLNIESKDGGALIFWELNAEFAYRKGGWNPKPWDIGFAQLVNDSGEPSGSGTKRAQIKGQDKKPVRHPVALANGIAKAAGEKPDVINGGAGVDFYEPKDFGVFGELFTPGQP